MKKLSKFELEMPDGGLLLKYTQSLINVFNNTELNNNEKVMYLSSVLLDVWRHNKQEDD